MVSKYHQRSASYLKLSYSIWAIPSLQKNRCVCVKPLRSRLQAILKLTPPVTPKGCKSFARMVNFVSMFCPELQKLLKPTYDLTKKGKPFLWEKEKWEALDEIKKRMLKTPVLSMPDRKGRFVLYSDTSTNSHRKCIIPTSRWKT